MLGPDASSAGSLSPDGRTVIYDVTAAGSSNVDLSLLPLDRERRSRLLFTSPAVEFGGEISPESVIGQSFRL